MKNTETNHALEQAKGQVASIVDMVAALDGSERERLSEQIADLELELTEKRVQYANHLVDSEDDKEIRNEILEEIAELSRICVTLEKQRDELPDEEGALQVIHEDPLEVALVAPYDWDEDEFGPYEGDRKNYIILLCWGGPAVRIAGNLDRWEQPNSAVIEYQDWGTSWTEYYPTREEREALLKYAQQFCFEGLSCQN